VSDSFIRDRSALIIWSGCLEDMDLQVDAPVMSLDILPTLSNLFGVKYDSRLMCGRDVLSNQLPLVFWLDGSWKTDKGSYNGNTGVFTPAEGVEVSEEYLKQIRAIINNKCNLSKAVSFQNYFNYINAELEKMNAVPEETAPTE
jgi:lipoteichoic acid synthase